MYNKSGTLMNKEFVAYKGKAYQIEWYFNRQGKSIALDYYLSLTAMERIRVLMLFKKMGDVGCIKDKTKFNYEGDKLYAFKPIPDRFLCFFMSVKKPLLRMHFEKRKKNCLLIRKSEGKSINQIMK